jgi:hypothetical protein
MGQHESEASFLLALWYLRLPSKRAAPDHFGVNIFCLDGFEVTSLPVRATQGLGMSVVCDDPRREWPGPRVASATTEQ